MKKVYYIVVAVLVGIIVWKELSRKNSLPPDAVIVDAIPQKKVVKKNRPVVSHARYFAEGEAEAETEWLRTVLLLKSQASVAMLFKLAPRYDVEVTAYLKQIHLCKILFRSQDLLDELISLLPGALQQKEEVIFKAPKPLDSPADSGFANGLNNHWPIPDNKDSGRGVTIAILDSGVADLKHFKQKIKRIDLVADGVPLSNSHGTSVASVILGDSETIQGVAPKAHILDVRVMNNDGVGSGLTIAQGIVAAVDKGAHIINLSIGSPDSCAVLQRAVEYAANKDVMMIAAVGNEGADTVSFPAAYDGVIGVGAGDENELYQSFSNRGSEVDLSAPGLSIPAFDLNGEQALVTGTSFATPIVTGTLAYLKSLYPQVSNGDLLDLMKTTANDKGLPGHDNNYGEGTVNLQRAANRDTVYDIAVADAVLAKDSSTGAWKLICSGENRGTETIKSIEMRVEAGTYSNTLYFRNVEPNSTFSEEISFSTPPVLVTMSLKASFVDDAYPENNTKTIQFFNKIK